MVKAFRPFDLEFRPFARGISADADGDALVPTASFAGATAAAAGYLTISGGAASTVHHTTYQHAGV